MKDIYDTGVKFRNCSVMLSVDRDEMEKFMGYNLPKTVVDFQMWLHHLMDTWNESLGLNREKEIDDTLSQHPQADS